MNAARGLIFDCDGVLVDSEQFSCGAWLPVRRRRGIAVDLGMKAIGFASSHPEAVLREAGAQVVLGSYAELLQVVA